MALTLDTIGERYKMLPSQVLREADTLDLWVMDVALSWHEFSRKKSQGKLGETLSQEDLQAIIKKTRGTDDKTKS